MLTCGFYGDNQITLCRPTSFQYVQTGQGHFSSDLYLCLLTTHQRRIVAFVAL